MPYVFSSLGLGNLQGASQTAAVMRREAEYKRQEADCLEKRAQDLENWSRCGPVLLADSRKWRNEAATLRTKAEDKRQQAAALEARIVQQSQSTIDEIARLRRDADISDQIAAQMDARANLGGRLSDIQRSRREAEQARAEAAQMRAKADALEAAL